MRKAKSDFYVNKINDCSKTRDIKESWSLINSRLNDHSVTDLKLIAESLNDYFVDIELDLAAD